MEVFKTYLFFEGFDEGHPHLVETIFHEGAWWLVGSWLQHHATQTRVPERIVRLTGLQFEEVQGQPYRFLLNNGLPKPVLDGEARAGYVVAMYPGLGRTTEPT
jgi:hypothetical protein